MKTIAVFTPKGGTGKTTTAVNVAHIMATEEKKKILVIDADPQGNATMNLGIDPNEVEKSLHDLMTTNKTAVFQTQYENLHIIPASVRLADIDDKTPLTALRDVIERIKSATDYEYIIIDTPPTLGRLSVNVILAADEVLVTYEPSYFSTKGIVDLVNTINAVNQSANKRLRMLGIVTTKYDKRSRNVTRLAAELNEAMPGEVFRTKIRLSEAIRVAQERKIPIAAYATRYAGYDDYRSLTKEIIERME